MKRAKQTFIGLGLITTTLAMASFSRPDLKEENGKHKKYHVIHQQDGVMHEFDTILPANSEYTVADFLAKKGIDNDNVQVINISKTAATHTSEEGEELHMILRQIDEKENSMHKKVKIIREDNGNGKVTMKKYINGQEVEVTEEDINNVSIHHGEMGNRQTVVIDSEKASPFEWNGQASEEKVEINVEVDGEGNKKMKKFVNGEEGPLSEKEIEALEQGNGRVIVFHEEDDFDMNSIISLVEKEVDTRYATETDGEHRVIVKEIRVDGETTESDSKEIKKDVRIEQSVEVAGDEDFTVVLVTENVDANAAGNTEIHIQKMNTKNEKRTTNGASTLEISVFPNPNDGVFTVAFEQKNEVKTVVCVVDMQGKVVFKEKLGAFSGSYRKELDLKKHGAGVYVVKVQQGNETSARKVIVE